tara:strand:- start:2570 stop:3166 length:597 start_codon:yes stop_codon:yes gene_type:complete
MNDAKVKFGSLSLNNQYQVHFAGFNGNVIQYLKFSKRIDNAQDFISREAGLLCSDASLPASAFATAEVKDNFMGIPQEFAHSRLYTDIDFSFYVDDDYTMLNIFEGWMDYISSGAEREVADFQKPFYRRMRYPDTYKCDTMFISKFEKNAKRILRYQFINAFPKSITPIPVQYGSADLLKVNVSFNYDRYVVANKKGL